MGRAEEYDLVYLDTHVVMWLYDGLVDLLSSSATEALERGRLFVCGMVELELQYLYEIGRVRPQPREVLGTLAQSIGLQRSDISLTAVAAHACTLTWTRDPFDRLIAAEAEVARARLVTRDENFLEHCPVALW